MTKRDDTAPQPIEGRSERWGRAYGEFFILVGRCITEWSNIEARLFSCFRECLGASKEVAAIVYYKTPNLEARITLCDELIKSIIPSHKPGEQPHSSLKFWVALRKDVADLLSLRRRIAHQPISEINNYLEYAPVGNDPIFQIQASAAEMMRAKASASKPIMACDLEDHIKRLYDISFRLDQFYELLLAQR